MGGLQAILKGEPIKVFNHGKMMRDFTYIDDIVEGVIRIQDVIPGVDFVQNGSVSLDSATSLRCAQNDGGLMDSAQNDGGAVSSCAQSQDPSIPYALFNIGNNEPIQLARFIQAIETATGREAEKIMLPMQPGDVERTFADTQRLEDIVGYKPQTEIEDGIEKFVTWYKEFKKEI